ncbi:MAG TPA: hypothetical protein VNV65_10370 [Candidatus Solibacter sp.]|nr:hypothetical protein [Candidatus Solibacter sp.]
MIDQTEVLRARVSFDVRRYLDPINRTAVLQSGAVASFLSAVVSWEVFASDWTIQAIADQPERFVRRVNRAIEQHAREAEGSIPAFSREHIQIIHGHIQELPTLREIRELLIASDQNLSIRHGAWAGMRRDLAPTYASRLAWLGQTPAHNDELLMNAAFSLRDLIAHRSQAARDRLRTDLDRLRGPDSVLTRIVYGVGNRPGSYLVAAIGDGSQVRLEYFLDRLSQLSQHLG